MSAGLLSLGALTLVWPVKVVPEMACPLSPGGTLKPTHSLAHRGMEYAM